MPDDVVVYEEQDSVAVVTINRPDKLNTLNEAVIEGIAEAIDRASASTTARAPARRTA